MSAFVHSTPQQRNRNSAGSSGDGQRKSHVVAKTEIKVLTYMIPQVETEMEAIFEGFQEAQRCRL